MPKFSFNPSISLGNILAIITMIGGLWGFAQAYGALGKTVEEHTAELVELKASAQVQANQQAEDRLFMREALAELRTDVGYLRRSEEEDRRQEREANPK